MAFALPTFAQEQKPVDPQVHRQIEDVFMKSQQAYNDRDAAAIPAVSATLFRFTQ